MACFGELKVHILNTNSSFQRYSVTSSMEAPSIVTCTAPVNIAVIKYCKYAKGAKSCQVVHVLLLW